jgi:hypothetical protein
MIERLKGLVETRRPSEDTSLGEPIQLTSEEWIEPAPEPCGGTSTGLVTNIEKSLCANLERIAYSVSVGATAKAQDLLGSELQPRIERLEAVETGLCRLAHDLRSTTAGLNESARLSAEGQRRIVLEHQTLLRGLQSRCAHLDTSIGEQEGSTRSCLEALKQEIGRLCLELASAKQSRGSPTICMTTSESLKALASEIRDLTRHTRLQQRWLIGALLAMVFGTALGVWSHWPAGRTSEALTTSPEASPSTPPHTQRPPKARARKSPISLVPEVPGPSSR